jgi:hypothetical protein
MPSGDPLRNAAVVVIVNGDPIRTCFGVACPLRRSCLRYLAVDCTPGASTRQATCCLDGTYPDYLYAMTSEISMHLQDLSPVRAGRTA